MFFTGISDEAGKDIKTQIKAHQNLGWDHLELRLIEDDFNLASLPEKLYQQLYEQLQEARMLVSCFASGIANWAKKISGDFDEDLNELKNALPRMHALKIPYVRIMSYPNDNWPDLEWFNEVVRRLKLLAQIAADNGIILVHENCSGWGGIGPEQTLQLLDAVDSPALKLVFDTGNPPAEDQDGWNFYQQVKSQVVYVHIKDALLKKQNGETIFTFPGEGDGSVKKIVSDLLHSGYDGGFSIEPHLTAVIHLHRDPNNINLAFDSYIDYGRRFMKLVASCKKE